MLGLGYIATVTCASFAAKKWGTQKADEVDARIAHMWILIEGPLFGLAGADLVISELDNSTLWKALIIIGVGIGARLPITFCSVIGNEFSVKEKMFVVSSWIPKATVQAALGGVILAISDN